MTYQEAMGRIPDRELPAFWLGDVSDLPYEKRKLHRGLIEEIAITPGGRPMHVLSYGPLEALPQRANFNSAVGGRDLSAYLDKGARSAPVLFFVGPVHGQETEALTGLGNLIEIMETGRDLRGRDQSVVRSLGERCRLLIVPAGNPDGMARFEARSLHGMSRDDVRFWGQGTWTDGSFCSWPECKRRHPMRGDDVGFLGCYFNDAGINPMHDEFFHPLGPEAPAILEVARREGPDLIVSLHSHSAAPALLRPAYVPREIQETVRDLAVQYYGFCAARSLPHGVPFDVRFAGGDPPPPFNLVSALYHVSGAPAFVFECPHGVRDEGACRVSLEEILDMQLTLYEAMMRFALA